MTQRTLRDIRPTLRELASVVAGAFPRQTWPQRGEMLGLAARMVWVRIKIGAFLILERMGPE